MKYLILSLCLFLCAAETPKNVIQSVSEAKLDCDLNSSLIIGNDKEIIGLKTTSICSKTDKGYCYTYVVKNISTKETISASWDLIGQVFAFDEGKSGINVIFVLKPGEKRSIKLTHKDGPKESYGLMSFWDRDLPKDAKAQYAEVGLEIPDLSGIKLPSTGIATGWIPKSWSK